MYFKAVRTEPPCYIQVYCLTFVHLFRNELCMKAGDCLNLVMPKMNV